MAWIDIGNARTLDFVVVVGLCGRCSVNSKRMSEIFLTKLSKSMHDALGDLLNLFTRRALHLTLFANFEQPRQY